MFSYVHMNAFVHFSDVYTCILARSDNVILTFLCCVHSQNFIPSWFRCSY